MAINPELRRVEALAAASRLEPDDADVYRLITKVRDALDDLGDAH